MFHHEREHLELRCRSTRVSPPRPCPRRGPGPVLEGLRVAEPALRELHPEPCLGGSQSPCRSAPRLDADDLPGWRVQGGRAEDASLPTVAHWRHPRATRPTAHLAPGRDLAVGWRAQAGLLEAADRFPITSGVSASDPTTVSLPRARHRIRAGISEQTRPAAAKKLDCLQIINNRRFAVGLPRSDEFLRPTTTSS